MKYIDSEKLIAEIERRISICEKQRTDAIEVECYNLADDASARMGELRDILETITSLQQEQPKGNLEYWLEHFGMPKENIDNCITQIAQGYGACRYLEGIQHGAQAVNELAKQEQPETIGGVVHHALNVHWLVVNKKKLSARLKQFQEGTEVEILINARKEGAK